MNKLSFKKWMFSQSNVEHIGTVVRFYIPINKIKENIRKELHEFLVSNYNAYTHESSQIKGYWNDGKYVLKDKHEKYEVSFKGKNKFKNLVSYLSKLCKETKEDAIYLTVGDESYLVRSK